MNLNLSKYDEMYAAADAPENSYIPLPSGNYLAAIDNLEFKEINGTWRLSWHMHILKGEHAYRKFRRLSTFNEQGMPFLKQDMALIGLGHIKLSELPQYLEDIVGMIVEVQVRTKEINGEMRENIYLKKRISVGDKTEDNTPF